MIKRLLDISLSLFALLVLSPLLIFIFVLVRIKLGGPAIFKQIRPGLYGKPFMMYKFRTMTNEKDKNGELLDDEERLTSFGKWLRSSSLDELPEFFNVLIGDMSLVGPRPLLMEYLTKYSERQKLRNNAKPGITGWAQIKGRNAISWSEKFELDIWYVKNQNFLLDLKIIILTIIVVFKKEGISDKSGQIMPKFTGNKDN